MLSLLKFLDTVMTVFDHDRYLDVNITIVCLHYVDCVALPESNLHHHNLNYGPKKYLYHIQYTTSDAFLLMINSTYLFALFLIISSVAIKIHFAVETIDRKLGVH